MFPNKRKSQAGFSLVELMVVVAIIGVLASIAVPSVNKYIAKARQTEAKTQLSSYYTAQKAFFAEYSSYHSYIEAIGYTPEGQLRYNVGTNATYVATASNGFNGQAGTNNDLDGYCGANGTMTNNCTLLLGANGNSPSAIAGGSVSQNAFTAEARARIASNAGTDDMWQITQNKVMSNTTNGIP